VSEEALIIVGAGGHGSELRSYVQDLGASAPELLGFLDDGKPVGPLFGTRMLGGLGALPKLVARHPRGLHYVTAFGTNAIRLRVVEGIERLGLPALRPWTLRHPSAQIGYQSEVGEGSLLAPNVVLTSRVKIGRHCILNVRVSVSHDCEVGDFVNINPAATVCGNVSLGDGAYVGAGAIIKEKVKVGRNAVIGAGAVVIQDVPDAVTVVGVPARVVGRRSEEGA
jgi:sugar O-acyltransferase (sialic acid O-acetyltransferase NeuD family)